MSIQKLIIEDVRCFAGRQEFNIRPLTFLVGENSTGKSTVLGCFDALLRFMRTEGTLWSRPGFQRPAVPDGRFCRHRQKSQARKEELQAGFEFRSENKNENIEYVLTLAEKEKGSEPVVQEQKLAGCNSEIIFLGGEQEEVERSGQRFAFRRFFELVDASEEGGRKQFRIRISEPFATLGAFAALDFSLGLSEGQESLSPEEKEFQRSMRNVSGALDIGRRSRICGKQLQFRADQVQAAAHL